MRYEGCFNTLRLMARDSSYPNRKMVSISNEMAKAIDDYRFLNRIPSETEALRQLLDLGLQVAHQRQAAEAAEKVTKAAPSGAGRKGESHRPD